MSYRIADHLKYLMTPDRTRAVVRSRMVTTLNHHGQAVQVHVGFKGKWKVSYPFDLPKRFPLGTGPVLYFLKALSEVIEELKLNESYRFGTVHITDRFPGIEREEALNWRGGILLRVTGEQEGKTNLEIMLTPVMLLFPRDELINHIRAAIQVNLQKIDRLPRIAEGPEQLLADHQIVPARIAFVRYGTPHTYGQRLLIEQSGHLISEAVQLEAKEGQEESIVREILGFNPDHVLLTLDDQDVFPAEIFLSCLSNELSPGVPLFAGGPGVTNGPEVFAHVLDRINFLFRGDGDYEFSRLLRIWGVSRTNELTPFQLAALATFSGSVVHVPGSLLVTDLDMSSEVEPEHFVMAKPIPGEPDIRDSRSCTLPPCRFCGRTVSSQVFASAQAVFENLLARRALEPEAEKTEVWFTSDDNLMQADRFLTLADLVEQSSLQGHLDINLLQVRVGSFLTGRAGSEIDHTLIAALKRIGVSYVTLGTDGWSDRTLKQLGKPYTFRDALRVDQALKKAGIRVKHNILLYNPFTELIDVAELVLNVEAALKAGVEANKCQTHVFPMYGTFFGNLFVDRERATIEERFGQTSRNRHPFLPEISPWYSPGFDLFYPLDPKVRHLLTSNSPIMERFRTPDDHVQQSIPANCWDYIFEYIPEVLDPQYGLVVPGVIFYDYKLASLAKHLRNHPVDLQTALHYNSDLAALALFSAADIATPLS